nr:DUF86 domain-containing protein [Actinomycetospora corticicola]
MLRSVSDELDLLSHEAAADGERRADPIWLRGVKYSMISAVEGCVDVAQHLCSSEGWGPPADNGDAMRVLGRHGVVERDHADRLVRAVGFRNVLVHEYVDVDDRIMLDRLADLTDLRRFQQAVAVWLHEHQRP